MPDIYQFRYTVLVLVWVGIFRHELVLVRLKLPFNGFGKISVWFTYTICIGNISKILVPVSVRNISHVSVSVWIFRLIWGSVWYRLEPLIVFHRYQIPISEEKSVCGIGIDMNLGYWYRYDKNPNIGISMKWNPDISISMILVWFGINVKILVSGIGITSGIHGKRLISVSVWISD